MAEQKTKSGPFDREAWLAGVDPKRRDEADRLLALFAEETGWEPRLWGPSMVGFGRYVYRYDSGHGGESLATGFSPRRAELSIYLMAGDETLGPILARLGPHRMAKACLYIKRLDAVDGSVLREVIRAAVTALSARRPVHPV